MKNIIDKIKKGEIKMKPKAHFVLRTLLIVLGTSVGFLFALYLTSFILFSMQAVCGLMPILISLPWLLIFLSVALIIVLEILTKQFSFVYRRPVLYIVLVIIISVLFGSFVVNKTKVHPFLFDRAEKHRLPIMGPMYRGYGKPVLPIGGSNLNDTKLFKRLFMKNCIDKSLMK